MMRTLVRMDLTKVRVGVIGFSSVEAQAQRQPNGLNRLKPATQRAFVLQFLSLSTLRVVPLASVELGKSWFYRRKKWR